LEWEGYYSRADSERQAEELDALREAVIAYNRQAVETGQKPITKQLLMNASRRGAESRRKDR
jgi:hypothetical protein